MRMFKPSILVLSTALISVFALSGCSSDGEGGITREAKYPTGLERDGSSDSIYEKPASIFGDNGLSFGGKRDEDTDESGSGIGVNSFLWRASLDTVSFMPLASADPFGGVILTDWHMPDETAGERFKMNVFILGRQLRSDGIRVRVFRQVYQKGKWVDAPTAKDTARKVEDSILTRARQMRVAQTNS